jgi:hypothetical protein
MPVNLLDVFDTILEGSTSNTVIYCYQVAEALACTLAQKRSSHIKEKNSFFHFQGCEPTAQKSIKGEPIFFAQPPWYS